ncbi:MAG: F0F1 ATP synthase subunit A [Rhizobiales bacterium]|nr:F0F1 ATP synthase subunit A [Hyphomicrobiales bacterium]MBN9008866.1 F0F1 ATP synthase subunit A [Hyphomicrobiales bacterium]
MAAEDPIHQFHIERLVPIHIGGLDISFTNAALFMVLTVLGAGAFLLLSTGSRRVVPGRWQSAAELTYEFVAKTVRDSAGEEGMRFFPFVFALFMFVLVANLWGLFPYFFTVTAQIIVTAALSLAVILTVLIYGLWRHKLHFFHLFVPSGVPKAILPFVVLIEVLSFVSRPISLSIRLFANMLAGHITLKVFAGFVTMLGSLGAVGIVGAILPLAATVGLTALELLVAALQAYVFAVLASLYLNDALHPGH